MTGDVIVKKSEDAGGRPTTVRPEMKIVVIGRSNGADTDATCGYQYDNTTSENVLSGAGVLSGCGHDYGEYTNTIQYVEDGDDDTYKPGIHFTVEDSSGNTIDPDNIEDSDGNDLKLEDLTLDWGIAPNLIPPSLSASVEETASAGSPSTVVTWYGITLIDKNGNESTLGPAKKVSHYAEADTSELKIKLSWVKKDYADKYKIYRTTEDFGLTEPAYDDFNELSEITDVNQTSYTDTAPSDSLDPSTPPDPASGNNALQKPENDDWCDLYYSYADVVVNTPQEFYTWQEVRQAHGNGSELTNVARLYMSDTFNGVDNLITIVPEDSSLASYLACLDELETEEVYFAVMLYAGNDDISTYWSNIEPVYNHCYNLSDPEDGQMERKAVISLPNDATPSDLDSLLTSIQAKSDDGDSCYLIVPDGFKVTIDSWMNNDGTYSYNVSHTDPSANAVDITPLVFGGAVMASYLSMGDIAEPMTEKTVAGFTLTGKKFSKTRIQQYTNDGAMVVQNVGGTNTVYRSINAGYPDGTLESAELNIVTTEDYMKKDLRRRMRALRGHKMTIEMLNRAKRMIQYALDYYASINLIDTYEGVSVSQNDTESDRLDAYFSYKPMYPINKIWIEFGYTFELNE